jgi:hypothetical protein
MWTGKNICYVNAIILFKVEAMLTISAGLSVQSVFQMRSFRDPDAVTARASLISDHGDAFALVNVYREWIKVLFGKENF